MRTHRPFSCIKRLHPKEILTLKKIILTALAIFVLSTASTFANDATTQNMDKKNKDQVETKTDHKTVTDPNTDAAHP
jgi:hypothetical protein